MTKQLAIIGGPNGCGKSTLAEFLLRESVINSFVNADIIAQGMSLKNSGLSEIEAVRVMLQRLHSGIACSDSLAFETTLAGQTWRKLIEDARQDGYVVTLYYVLVKSPELALERVSQRVAEGGHHIAEDTVRRRYARSKKLFFETYQHLVDSWWLFDNTGAQCVLIASKTAGELRIFDKTRFDSYRGNPDE